MRDAPIGMAMISLDGKILEVNDALCLMLGYTAEQLKTFTIYELTFAEDLDISFKFQQGFLEGKNPTKQLKKRYIKKDGTVMWATVSGTLIRDRERKPSHFITQIQDITAEKHNEEVVENLHMQTKTMLLNLQQHSDVMSAIKKMNELLQAAITLNESYEIIKSAAIEIFPLMSGCIAVFNPNEDCFQTVSEWGDTQVSLSSFQLADCWALREGKNYRINSPKDKMVCHHFTNKLESSYICVPLIMQGKTFGLITIFSALHSDFTKHDEELIVNFTEVISLSLSNLKLRDELQDQAIHDPLTKLYNRRFLEDVLPRNILLTIREKSSLCVAMLDIDYFKKFNDEHGHEAGDQVLIFIGNLLDTNFRGSDIACRFGGEEFLVVMMSTTSDKAFARLDDIREQIKNTQLHFNGKLLPPATISIGVAQAPQQASTYEAIIGLADKALYVAKQSGRDQVQIAKFDKEIS